jgi:GAF domain-containing protein
MNRDNTYLQLLIEVTTAITSKLVLDELFTLITEKIPEAVGVDAATIRLLDATGKRLVLQAASGLSDAYLDRGPVDAEESVMEALKGNPIAIDNVPDDPRTRYPEAARAEGIQSMLVLPISVQDKITGILRLLSRSRRHFDPGEVDFAAALAKQCGIAIENARIYEDQKRQLGYFKALHEIGKRINATYELGQILDLIVKRLPEVMHLKACTIRLIETSRGELELKAAYGLSRSYLERGPLDAELATHYILEGEPVVITDAKSDLHALYHKEAAAEGIGSVLAVPITVKDEIIGMLRLLTAEIRSFSAADINFAMAVADQSGLAIQRAMDYEKMQQA